MRARLLVLLFVLASGLEIFAQDTPSPSPNLRAAFWNIQWFPGRRPNASAAAERQQIASVQRDLSLVNLDILGMEEVRNFEQAGVAVANLPGFKVDVCSNFPRAKGRTSGSKSRSPAASYQ